MTEGIIRKKEPGQAWETVLDTGGGGGGGGLGVWKTFGVDSSNQPFDQITIGDGTMLGRWWTPAAVVPAVETVPFLCIIEAQATLGSTSTVDGTIATHFPTLVDGSGFDIAAAQVDALGVAFSHIGADQELGWGTVGGPLKSVDGTVWDATHPHVWAQDSIVHFVATFQAVFTAD